MRATTPLQQPEKPQETISTTTDKSDDTATEKAKEQAKEPKKNPWGGLKGIFDSFKSDNVFKDNEA